jgi:hypothetical protein
MVGDIFIKYGAISKRRRQWQRYLDLLRLRSNMDSAKSRRNNLELAFNIIIINGPISKRSDSKRVYIHLIQLRSNVDVPNRNRNSSLEIYILIFHRTVSKRGG